MGRAESRDMHRKIVAAREATLARQREANAARLACPIESAKTYIRSRGWHVFAERILPGRERSKLIVVGTNPMTAEAVLAMAERLRSRA